MKHVLSKHLKTKRMQQNRANSWSLFILLYEHLLLHRFKMGMSHKAIIWPTRPLAPNYIGSCIQSDCPNVMFLVFQLVKLLGSFRVTEVIVHSLYYIYWMSREGILHLSK